MNGITNFIICYVLQIAATIGLIFVFGKVIALCNARFYRGFGSKGGFVCRFTGLIGTPIHELSHALLCVIFGHKVIEMKFYSFSSDGVMGYVNHTYNRKNIYQRVGNLFIGIAPIIVGSLILCGLLYLLLPKMFTEVCADILSVNFISDAGGSFRLLGSAFLSCFSYIGRWQWWVFLIIGSFIALHMTLSKADIKGALSGLVFFLLIMLVADIILALIGQNVITAFTGYILIFGSFLLFFFVLFLIIMLILLGVQFIIRLIFRRH